jgi:hypothetical protein
MLKAQIKVGGYYLAKVNNQVVRVRVDAIREVEGYGNRYFATKSGTRYEVTNTKTGRHTTFRSASKFRGEVSGPA